MAGAPTSYKPEYCKGVVDHMGGGLSFASYAGTIGVTYMCLYNWRKKHPEFALAHDLGHARYLLYWEQLGNDGALGQIKDFSFPTWYRNMINRFGWGDKATVQIQDDNAQKDIIELDDAELSQQIAEALKVVAEYENRTGKTGLIGSETQEATVIDAVPSTE